MKRAFIVHGWDGYPEECWFPWLKKELEAKGFQVFVPQLPDAPKPRIQNWVPALMSVVGSVDRDTYFVGHSTGCKTILCYLNQQPAATRVGGIVLVGPWLTKLKTLAEEAPEDQIIAQEWLDAPLDWEKIRTTTGQSVGVFSDNDQYVDLLDAQVMKEKLGSSIVVEHQLGHMGTDVHCTELPSVRNAVLEMAADASK